MPIVVKQDLLMQSLSQFVFCDRKRRKSGISEYKYIYESVLLLLRLHWVKHC